MVPLTLAVNCWVFCGAKLTLVGVKDTEIVPAGGCTMVIDPVANLELSALLVARIVTVAGLGTVAGAV